MPVGGPVDQPRPHVVTLPASEVDWTRTDAMLRRRAISVTRRRAARTTFSS